jgi:hypothetical protein
MAWPMNDKSKSIIKMVEHFEHSVYGEQMETWSPRSTTHHHLIIHRINKILNELGYTDSPTMELQLHKKIELIAHNLGISFWDEDSSESEDDGNILDAAESPVES